MVVPYVSSNIDKEQKNAKIGIICNVAISYMLKERTVTPTVVDISRFCPNISDVSINSLNTMSGVSRRTLTKALEGELMRCDWDTLFKILALAKDLSGKDLTLEDLFVSGAPRVRRYNVCED